MSSSRPDGAGAHGAQPPNGAWIALEDAAAALKLSQQTLWQRLREMRIEVRRVELGGRQLSAVRQIDLAKMSGRDSDALDAAPTWSDLERPPAEHEVQLRESDAAPRSLWQQLRELELQRDQLEFELRVVRTQLGDSRGRAQQAEESARALRGELEDARAGLNEARGEAERRREQFEALKSEHAGTVAAHSIERDRAASLERQMTKLIEIEKARERYCDQLEAKLQLRRGA